MFCGDGLGEEGEAPGWKIEEVYIEARRFEDITARILAELCVRHPRVLETLAGRCLAILRSDPSVDPRMSEGFRGLVADAIESDRVSRLRQELRGVMGDDLDLFLKGPAKP